MGPNAGRPEAVHPRPVNSFTATTQPQRTGRYSANYVSLARYDAYISAKARSVGRFTPTRAAQLEDVGGALVRAIRVFEDKGVLRPDDIVHILGCAADDDPE